MSKVYIRSLFNHISLCPLCAAAPGRPLCPRCGNALLATAAPLAGALCRCGLPLPGANPAISACANSEAPLCGRCLARPPPWHRLVPMGAYQPPLSTLIKRFKHQRCRVAEHALLRFMTNAWPAALQQLPASTLVVPVPLHWRRQWWRGFNQAARLAAYLAAALELPLATPLRRSHGLPQQGASAAQRRRRTIRYRCVATLGSRPVLLVDDVVTTGETARLASQALLRAGAGDIWVACIARTLPVP